MHLEFIVLAAADGVAVCLFSLRRRIFVSRLLIDSYLNKPWEWNFCWGSDHLFILFIYVLKLSPLGARSALAAGHLEVLDLFLPLGRARDVAVAL